MVVVITKYLYALEPTFKREMLIHFLYNEKNEPELYKYTVKRTVFHILNDTIDLDYSYLVDYSGMVLCMKPIWSEILHNSRRSRSISQH